MSTPIQTDLVPLLSDLVNGLQPFATAQEVTLTFTSYISSLSVSYNLELTLSEFTVLLNRIVNYTPQGYAVKVCLNESSQKADHGIVTIENTGVDLSKLGEILSSFRNGLLVDRLNKGTRFTVLIPKKRTPIVTGNQKDTQNLLPKQYPNYYTSVSKRLTTYFSNSQNFEKAAAQKSSSAGVFLRKVNSVIHFNLADSDFKVDTLADSMALSRTQLFRKIKALTGMSPQRYLRFVRLERAKKLLQSREQDLNVSEVCYEVGFASKSHFTRSFHKEFGFTPSEITKNRNVT